MRAKRVAVTVVAGFLATLALALPAQASGPNYAKAWETLLGCRWNGYVQIQASYNDGGKHAKQGYQRFTRKAGPALDTGRKYTSKATSKTDRTVRSKKNAVWDSPLWGDSYKTKFFYGFIYF